ncbi:MAG: hydroxypyruvate isomerase family protein [Halobacteriaceae archaeon]
MVTLTGYLNLLFDEGDFPERVDRVAEMGLDGVEFYGWNRDVAAVADRIHANDLDFVYMSGGRPALCDPDEEQAAVENVEESIDLAAEHGCINLNVKGGAVVDGLTRQEMHDQTARVLERVAPTAEEAGVRLVLEPLNTTVDHTESCVATAHEGAAIVREVDSPAVTLLYDFYHEQIMAGDVIRSFRELVDVVGHVHIADNPGRHEPGTGEVNFANVFDAIDETGYDGYVGCEFVPTGDPAEAIAHVQSLN